MALIDDLALRLDQEDRTRRAFLESLSTVALSVAAAGTGVTAVRFLWPEVLFEEPSRFRLGSPEDVPVGTLVVLPEQRAYLMRTPAGFFAMSAVCTHLGCLTRFEQESNDISCPCHGSRFAADGRVTNGPAPRPLPRLALALDSGVLVIDTAEVVGDDVLLQV